MTTSRYCFMHEIIYNSRDVYIFTPNLVVRFAFGPQIIDKCSARFAFQPELSSVCKKKIKNEKVNIFKSLIACISGKIFIKFGIRPLLSRGSLHCIFGAIWIRHYRVFFYCQNTHSVAHTSFCWAASHTVMCRDQYTAKFYPRINH